MMKVDLHSHSTESDGTFSPEALVQLAKNADIDILALTDHDTMSGVARAKQAADVLGVRLIAGVEMSTTHELMGGYGKNKSVHKIIHVVGLNIQDEHAMQQALCSVQNSRADRARQMIERLALIFSRDVETLWALALAKVAGNAEGLGRAHIAQVLFELGLVKSIQEAFDKFLADGKSAYVAIQTFDMSAAIHLIHRCGGCAVLAHPTRYRLSATLTRKLIADFAHCGGDACELPSPSEPISTRQMIDRMVLAHNLKVSVGSDFHGTTMPWRALGKVASVGDGQTPVWQQWL